jgi:hypothetical protein
LTGKHNLRLSFSKKYGAAGKLSFAQDPLRWDPTLNTWNGSAAAGFAAAEYPDLVLHQPTQSSWGCRTSNSAKYAAYVQEQWMHAVFQQMAQPLGSFPATTNPHTRARLVQVYINGLYWGPYFMGERLTEDWLNKTYGTTGLTFDIVKEDPPTAAGDYVAWTDLRGASRLISNLLLGEALGTDEGFAPAVDTYYNRLLAARAAHGAPLMEYIPPTATAPTTPTAYEDRLTLAEDCYTYLVAPLLDLENYIDYLLVYHYAGERDWPTNNWTIARATNAATLYPTRPELGKFRCFIAGSELGYLFTHPSHAPGSGTGETRFNSLKTQLATTIDPAKPLDNYNQMISRDSVSLPAYWLRMLPSFKTAFKARVQKHYLTPGGVFYRPLTNPTTPTALPCKTLFDAFTRDFRTVWYGEGARWGDMKDDAALHLIQLGPDTPVSTNYNISSHWTWLANEWFTDPAIPHAGTTPGRRAEALLDLAHYSLVP